MHSGGFFLYFMHYKYKGRIPVTAFTAARLVEEFRMMCLAAVLHKRGSQSTPSRWWKLPRELADILTEAGALLYHVTNKIAAVERLQDDS